MQPESEEPEPASTAAAAREQRAARLTTPPTEQVPEVDATEQMNGVVVPGTWYGATGQTVLQEEEMPSPIPLGTMVQLHSLSSEGLNGKIGECGKLNARKGRYKVALLGE